MKILHMADLHIGKRVNDFSMLEDQGFILQKILTVVEKEMPDAILIAGDVYDKAVPSAEAVSLLDDFLVKLSRIVKNIFLVSGNHDSVERISFGSRIMQESGIYVSRNYQHNIQPIELEDDYGKVCFYLLPFLKPIHVKPYATEQGDKAETYDEAVKIAIKQLEIDKSCRNVLITHQFVAGAITCESEELSVGGTDQVDVDTFKEFDYVALGHLHGPQKIGRDTIRYSGSPLKYSFSESKQKKSITMIHLLEKGNITIELIPLQPKRDMCELKGTYMELTSREFYESLNKDDYYHITLTDEEDIVDGIQKLRVIYPNSMRLDYDNTRTKIN